MPARAFVLSAGLGTRLRPYTNKVPKPLFHILGRPLLGIIFDQLKGAGFSEIGLNLFHLSHQIKSFVADYARRHPELKFFLFEEKELLGPVGAFKGAASFFEKGPVLVINGDILTNFPFKTLLEAHHRLGGVATLLLHYFERHNKVVLAGEKIVDFRPGEGYAFTGVQVVTPKLIKHLVSEDREMVPVYRRLIAKGLSFTALVGAGFYWRDIGDLSSYLKAHEDLLKRRAVIPQLPPPRAPQVLEGASLGEGVILEDWVFLEPQVEVAPRAKLKRVVAWAGAKIPEGTHVETLFI